MRITSAFAAALLAALALGRDTPILNGRLESDLNANWHAITNLPPGFFPTNGFLRARDIAGKADRADTYTKGETDARIAELAPPVDLSLATNYTDRATNTLAASSAAALTTATNAVALESAAALTSATNALATASAAAYMPQSNAYTKAETDARIITTNDVCAIVSNTAYGEWQFDGTSWVESGITPDDQARDNIPTTLLSLNWYYSLDDVPQAAKDILEGLYIDVTESILPVCYAVYTIRWSDIGWDRSGLKTNDVAGCNNTFLPFTETKVELTSEAYDYGFHLTRKEYNALGLARQSDIPTNHVTQAEMQEAIDGIEIPSTNGFVTASITNGLAATNWVSRASRFDHLYEIELYGTVGSPAPIYSFNGRMLSMTTEKTIFMGDLYDIANFEQDEAATYWHNFSSDRIFTMIIYADLTANESLNGVTIDAYEYPCSLFFSNLFLFILGTQVDFAENSDFASVAITEVE